MLDNIRKLGDEGLVTTLIAGGIAMDYADMNIYEGLDALTFGISSSVGDRIPSEAKDVIKTMAAIWAGLYIGGQVLSKGIDLPMLPELKFDFPGITSNEDNLF